MKGQRSPEKNKKCHLRTVARKAERRAASDARVQSWRSLSLQEQLALLPKDGATKQRDRIMQKIQKRSPAA